MLWQRSRNVTHLVTIRQPWTNVTKTFPVSWVPGRTDRTKVVTTSLLIRFTIACIN